MEPENLELSENFDAEVQPSKIKIHTIFFLVILTLVIFGVVYYVMQSKSVQPDNSTGKLEIQVPTEIEFLGGSDSNRGSTPKDGFVYIDGSIYYASLDTVSTEYSLGIEPLLRSRSLDNIDLYVIENATASNFYIYGDIGFSKGKLYNAEPYREEGGQQFKYRLLSETLPEGFPDVTDELLNTPIAKCGYFTSETGVFYVSDNFTRKIIEMEFANHNDFQLVNDSCRYIYTNGSAYYAYDDNWGGPYVPTFKEAIGLDKESFEVIEEGYPYIVKDKDSVFHGSIPFADPSTFEILGDVGFRYPVLFSRDDDFVYFASDPIIGLDPVTVKFDGSTSMLGGNLTIGDKDGECVQITQINQNGLPANFDFTQRHCLREEGTKKETNPYTKDNFSTSTAIHIELGEDGKTEDRGVIVNDVDKIFGLPLRVGRVAPCSVDEHENSYIIPFESRGVTAVLVKLYFTESEDSEIIFEKVFPLINTPGDNSTEQEIAITPNKKSKNLQLQRLILSDPVTSEVFVNTTIETFTSPATCEL